MNLGKYELRQLLVVPRHLLAPVHDLLYALVVQPSVIRNSNTRVVMRVDRLIVCIHDVKQGLFEVEMYEDDERNHDNRQQERVSKSFHDISLFTWQGGPRPSAWLTHGPQLSRLGFRGYIVAGIPPITGSEFPA